MSKGTAVMILSDSGAERPISSQLFGIENDQTFSDVNDNPGLLSSQSPGNYMDSNMNRININTLNGPGAVSIVNINKQASAQTPMVRTRKIVHDVEAQPSYLLILFMLMIMAYCVINGLMGLVVATGSASINVTVWLIIISLILFVLVILLCGVTIIIYWYTHRDYSLDHLLHVFTAFAVALVGTIIPIVIMVVWNRDYGGTPNFSDFHQFQQIAFAGLYFWPTALLMLIYGSHAIIALLNPERATQDRICVSNTRTRSEYMAMKLTNS